MKKYKLIYQYKGSYCMQYFDTKKEADTFAVRDDIETKSKPRQVELEFHHRASRRGYVTKDGGYDEIYSGKFGEGIIRHIPNVQADVNGSNNYHVIDFYIEKR